MATNNIVPPPPGQQDIVAGTSRKCDTVWLKWFWRLQLELAKYLPALGSANQILGVNAGGTANEYKTLTDGNGIDITFSTAVVTVTVNQMELGSVLAFAARHG